MKKNKIISLLTLSLAVVSLASCLEKEQADPNLYHLTLTANKEVDSSLLKATYAAGTGGSKVVTQGTRDADEIEELKKAGASEEDIAKAGVRQADGTYYFFDQDPMYLEAPKIVGYRKPVFYNKANSNDFYRTGLSKNDVGEDVLYFWNMPNKDTEMEARYEPVAYDIGWQEYTGELASTLGYENPNLSRTKYNFETDGFVTLLPATFTNPKIEFLGWEYQDVNQLDEYNQAKWVLLEDNKLPFDIEEEYLRIQARYQVKPLKVEFDFETDEGAKLDFDDVINSMSLKANLCYVDGVLTDAATEKTITSASIIGMDPTSGWAEFFFELKPEYNFWYVKLNGTRNDSIDGSHMDPPYISLEHSDISDDSVITFVVTPNN